MALDACLEDEEEDWSNPDWEAELDKNAIPNGLETAEGEAPEVEGSNSLQYGQGNEGQSGEVSKNGQSLMSRMLLNDNKAGMEGLDKEKINQIIYEASKGSRFFENELKKERLVNLRIEEQQRRLQTLTDLQLEQGKVEADKLLAELESCRDLSRAIVHIDMDMFYAAVEMRKDPTLRDKPMGVGGMGMLSTSNYIARRYGVRAAMPGFIGKKLCPHLVIVRPSYHLYQEVSKQVREILAKYDPNYSPMSLDEAYLDMTEHLEKRQLYTEKMRTFYKTICAGEGNPIKCCDSRCVIEKGKSVDCAIESTRAHEQPPCVAEGEGSDLEQLSPDLFESDNENDAEATSSLETDSHEGHQPNVCEHCGKLVDENGYLLKSVTFGLTIEDAVTEMRFRIEQKTQLTASAGIAPNTMLAKICSDKNKPNGQYRIQPKKEDIALFLKDLSIRKISGIGKVSEKILSSLGIVHCPDLYAKRGQLYHLHSSISFNHLMRIYLGIGSTRVESDGERKSISTERTFQEISKPNELYKKCEELCESLVEDLQEQGMTGKTVTLKLKTVKFEVKTRAQSLRHYTSSMEEIYKVAVDILKREMQACAPQPLCLRLMGVRMSNFLQSREPEQKASQQSITGFLQKKPDAASVIEANVSPKPEAAKSALQSTKEMVASTSTFTGIVGPQRKAYNCPVCCRDVMCTSLCAFNKHIDTCLAQQEATETSLDNGVVKSDTKSKEKLEQRTCTDENDDSKISFSVENALEGNKMVSASNSMKECVESPYDITGNHFSHFRGEKRSIDHAVEYICPICNKDQSNKSLALFTLHVEACLEGPAAENELDSQKKLVQKNSNGQPVPKKRKGAGDSRIPKIDSFFKR